MITVHIQQQQTTTITATEFSIQLHLLSRIHGSFKFDRGLHHATKHDLHWLDMADRILFQIALTVYRCVHGMLQTICLNSVFIQCHTAHHLDTVSDPSTETSLLSHQSKCLCSNTADDVLVYPAQLFGKAGQIISEIPLYQGFSALSKELLICTLLTFSDAIA